LIAPLSDHPDVTMTNLLERLETLLDRVPLNEKAALGVKETATYLGVSELIVNRLRSAGALVPLKNPFLGDRILFSRDAIDAFVAASHDQAREVA
jgi:hypothetical protein